MSTCATDRGPEKSFANQVAKRETEEVNTCPGFVNLRVTCLKGKLEFKFLFVCSEVSLERG